MSNEIEIIEEEIAITKNTEEINNMEEDQSGYLSEMKQTEIQEVKVINQNEIIKRDIEAILLLSGDDLQVAELAKFFKKSEEYIKNTLYDIRDELRDRGINLHIKYEKVYLATNSKSGESVHNFFNQEGRPKKLSPAAIETLSIIAYRQPVTKSEVEGIRGVAVDGVIHSLEEKKLISICGKKEGIGRPNLYGTTDEFLTYMGIESIDELPNYREVRVQIDRENENK